MGNDLVLQALAGKVPRQSLSVGGTLTVNGCMVPAEVGLSMLSGGSAYTAILCRSSLSSVE